MKILPYAQKSPEWHAARRGIFTASEAGEFIVGNDTATNRKARQNLIAKKLAEPFYSDLKFAELAGSSWLTQLRDKEQKALDYNPAINRGNDLEPLARAAFEKRTGYSVTSVGLCLHDSGGFGCSPDGLLGDDGIPFIGGLEIKCPIPETHAKYLLAGTLPDEYRPQVHCSLAVTGLQRWDFMSFCPGLPSLLVTVERDDYTERMLAGLLSLSAELEATRQKLAAMWAAEFGKEEAPQKPEFQLLDIGDEVLPGDQWKDSRSHWRDVPGAGYRVTKSHSPHRRRL